MQFKAAMFDFDGTITKKGEYSPNQQMADGLARLAQKVPIAFCTGRQLESFEHRGFPVLMKEIAPEDRDGFLRNLFLFAENGAVGYRYDLERAGFEELYQIGWPEDFMKREDFKQHISTLVSEYGEVYENAHKIVVVLRTRLHGVEDRDIEDVYALSAKIYEICLKTLSEMDPDFEKYLHVGNSGIGVVIGPANGDKDEGIKRFADFLSKNRGFEFDDKASEILVVGDSPQASGNDHYFLNGKYGTPYSVGEAEIKDEFPMSVTDLSGKKLLNDVGTLHLINLLF